MSLEEETDCGDHWRNGKYEVVTGIVSSRNDDNDIKFHHAHSFGRFQDRPIWWPMKMHISLKYFKMICVSVSKAPNFVRSPI